MFSLSMSNMAKIYFCPSALINLIPTKKIILVAERNNYSLQWKPVKVCLNPSVILTLWPQEEIHIKAAGNLLGCPGQTEHLKTFLHSYVTSRPKLE